ncbi:MAG: thioredoxin domain-containing protein [Myxococcota bacterium]|nr:thioredoxin domain-containing protein [Myxococcota bacterium]
MERISSLALAGIALLAFAGFGATCRGGGADPNPSTDVDVPGVDTRDFTPREKHEFSQYITGLPSPCSTTAVPIATCLIEKRSCAGCLPAAAAIARAVRDGMTREQVHDLYKQRFDVASVRTIPLDGSPSRGPDAAPVVVVEFADFECPFCQKLAPELDRMWSARKDKVRFVYKFLPLAMHHHGEIAARAAIAAQKQGKFWEMHDQLFVHAQHLEEEDLAGYAKAIGLDVDRFVADMAGAAAKDRVEADRKLADALGIKGTPTIFIDGREYDIKADIGDWVDGEIASATRR